MRRYMYIIQRTFLVFILAISMGSVLRIEAQSVDGQRIKYTLNDNWRFSAENRDGSERFGVDVSDWSRIDLPHNWNTKDAFDDEPGYRRGSSWYRKELQIDPGLKNKRIFLYFEGANQVADVYINERRVGQHIGGYSAFTFDVTEFARFDRPNILAVKVDNTFNEDIPPLTADFTFWGGIYRDVWLIAADTVHVKVTDLASPGVFITTPDLSENSGTVKIRGTIVNSGKAAERITVVNSVVDAAGKEVASVSTSLEIAGGSEAQFDQTTKSIAKPRLWSPEDPYLYSVRTSVVRNGRVADEITEPLGFRWFSFDPQKGFSLNGKPVKLRGTNRHQDHAGLGNALPDELHVRDMELMKSTGYNFVRLAHYPQDPAILNAADRLGLMLWEETPIVNYITISKAFNDNSANMVREMVRQHRNHPSVIMWGYMNEIFLRVPREHEVNSRKESVVLAKELNRIAKSEDPTRPTTIAFHGSEVYNTEGLGDVADITGWNLYNGWYSHTFEDFGKFIDEQHKRYPNRILFISEYGANSDLRLHSSAPRQFDSTTEYQRMFHESYLEQMKARQYLAGWTIWNEFDFGAEQRGENMPHVNNKGMFTYDRRPKDVHYFYKANYSSEPVVHIATRDWDRRAGADFIPHKIAVYSNLADVELFLNGVSLGRKTPNSISKATWDVTLREGKNVLSAQGRRGSELVADTADVDFKLITVRSYEIAINAGSNVQYLDETGAIWLEDTAYKPGSFGYVAGESVEVYAHRDDRNVLGTVDDPLFQTRREGSGSYRFDVPPGSYEIELRFAETKAEKPGERVFDVKINGQTMLRGLDLVKSVGRHTALTQRFAVRTENGILIELSGTQGKPLLCAVRIVRR
ncbi:MAG: glycoside hydrolase family 2 TIM barrel-domain containing protein [Pyrinomonadaceae bacterium]